MEWKRPPTPPAPPHEAQTRPYLLCDGIRGGQHPPALHGGLLLRLHKCAVRHELQLIVLPTQPGGGGRRTLQPLLSYRHPQSSSSCCLLARMVTSLLTRRFRAGEVQTVAAPHV